MSRKESEKFAEMTSYGKNVAISTHLNGASGNTNFIKLPFEQNQSLKSFESQSISSFEDLEDRANPLEKIMPRKQSNTEPILRVPQESIQISAP